MYEWDENKSTQCLKARGFDFSIVAGFDFDTAITIEDTRKEYGEGRYMSLGFIDDRLFSLVWTPREGVIRVISLRKANSRERQSYERRQKG